MAASALPVVEGHLYDYPRYYDAVFGSDCQAELKFLEACFQRYLKRPPRRLFEPACGTGRLLAKLAQRGYQVGGNDLNAKAVDYCNARLRRLGFPATAVVGDMSNFTLAKPADAAFNTINSFRHLATEQQARGHLESMARAVRPGGLYLLGLHLTPRGEPDCTEESWSARRGHLQVNSRMWTVGIDRRRRQEEVGMTFDIYTPTRQFRLVDGWSFRTYTARQMASLLSSVPQLSIVETFDFAYDIDDPQEIDDDSEDVVYVLRVERG